MPGRSSLGRDEVVRTPARANRVPSPKTESVRTPESLPRILDRIASATPSLHDAALSNIRKEKSRVRIHAATQTEVSEIMEMKQVQANLQRMWMEMSSVQAELAFAEQKIRHQMQEELELQMDFQEQRCNDKVQFMRLKSDSHVREVRKASYTKAMSEIIKSRREERVHREAAAKHTLESSEQRHADEVRELNELQRQYIVRVQELTEESKRLHARIKKHDEQIAQKEQEIRSLQHRDVQVIASLEQQVTAKEQEIQMLREQVTSYRTQAQANPGSFGQVKPPDADGEEGGYYGSGAGLLQAADGESTLYHFGGGGTGGFDVGSTDAGSDSGFRSAGGGAALTGSRHRLKLSDN